MSPETTEIGKVTSFVKPLGSRGYGTLDFTLQTLEPNCMSGGKFDRAQENNHGPQPVLGRC